MKNKFLIFVFVVLVCLAINVNAAEYCPETVSPMWEVGSASVSPSEVDSNEPVSITIPITSTAQNTAYTCVISTGSKSTSKQVQPGRTEELTLQINAPNYETSTQRTETVSVHVGCSGIWDRVWPLCDYRVYGEVTRSVSYRWPTQTYLQELQKYSVAIAEYQTSENLIKQAESSISKAKTSIQEAKSLGIGVATAESYLATAESKLIEAKDLHNTAKELLDISGDPQVATQKLKSAQNSATEAVTNANNAYSSAQVLIDEYKAKKEAEQKAYESAKLATQNSVSDAKSAVDRATEMVGKAKAIISDAEILKESKVVKEGLELANPKANLQTAEAKADLANNYYEEAKTALDQQNFDSAKSKASSAISYANEAENLATSAYTPIANIVQTLGPLAEALTSANQEVNDMNDIYTKTDFIIRSTEKYGVTLTEAKNVVSTAKTDIDNAEDLLSQAKHRAEAGVYQEAIDLAIQARDAASKSTNRLDTITQSISTGVQDALEKAYAEMEREISSVEAEVGKGEKTYGADSTQIINAKTDVSSARNNLVEAKSAIDKINVAAGLKEVLTEADTAFKKLDDVQSKLNEALRNVGSARTIRIIKIAGLGAAIAAAAGGGFLYYRKRRQPKAKEKPEKEKKKEPKKKGKHCIHCGAKLTGKEKFCSGCGEKT